MSHPSPRLNRRTLGGAALAATLVGSATARTFAQGATPGATASPAAEDGWDLSAVGFTTKTVVDGLDQPLWVVSPPDDKRLFIVNRTGTVVIVQDGKLVEQPFIDVSDRIITDGQEQGLLGLAFHPDYAKNGAFYLFYTSAKDTSETLSRFRVTDDPNVADPTSEVVQLNQPDKYANHNGGCVIFGPDGYLYTGIGDGGSAGDPDKNGQNLSTWLATLLRIDPDPTAPAGEPQYAVPKDNPFVNKQGAKPEIWAYGLRNPWRFSFDRETGDLWIGDVGQDEWEEIDFQPADSKGGVNYGWSIKEATHCYKADTCDSEGLTDPVAEYKHDVGVSVTGGYVYRGSAIPDLVGTYLFADYGTGRIWGLLPKGDGTFAMSAPVETRLNITSFGEDNDGELYISVFNQGGGSVMTFVPGFVMRHRRRTIPGWLPFAAAIWAFAFSCLHLMWALGYDEAGFRWSLALKGQAETDLIHDQAFRLEGLWGVVVLCWLTALIALATVVPWADRIPRRLRLIGAWGVCIVLLLRAFFYTGFVFSGLRVAGILPISERADSNWYRWDLVLWSPWFLLGAMLFGLSARRMQRRGRL